MPTINQIAVDLADRITASGMTIEPKKDSLIENPTLELIDLLKDSGEYSKEEMVEKTNEAMNINAPDVFAVEDDDTPPADPVGMGEIYGIVLDDTLLPVVTMATNIVQNIKGNIIPATRTIFDKAYAEATETVSNGGVQVDVVTDGSERSIWASVINHLELADVASRAPLDAVHLDNEIQFPSKSGQEIFEILTTTLPNEDFAGLVGDDMNALAGAYAYSFNVGGGAPLPCPRSQNIVVMTLARAFETEIPEGVTTNVTLERFKIALRALAASHAANLILTITRSENLAKADTLVLSFPPEGHELIPGAKIVVNGLLYDKYLDQGGSVDALFGAYVSDEQPRKMHYILENNSKLENLGMRRIALAQSHNLDNFTSIFAARLRSNIIEYAKENNLEVINGAFERSYEKMNQLTHDTAYKYARDLIIDSFFGDGDHRNILDSLDVVSEANPGLDLDECVDIVIVEWLVVWVLDQLKIGKA